MSDIETITLWRPVGPEELALIRDLDMRGFPPRLPDQPIFYPVVSDLCKERRCDVSFEAILGIAPQDEKRWRMPPP
ncbi:hypothetical protein ACC732_36210, partial [Rhizobium ruizarguesonis]